VAGDHDNTYAPFAAAWIAHVLAFAQAFSDQHSKEPELGSVADMEINHNAEGGPGGAWPRAAALRPYELAGGLMLVAVGQFLTSLRLLLVPDMALFGFQAVARATVEGAARAAWVLDPGISIRERVVRGSLVELDSIQEGRKVEVAGGGDGSMYGDRIADLKVRMALLGIDERHDRSGVSLIGFDGQVLEGKMEAVSRFLPHLGSTHGELWYRSMSGVSHSILYGITEYLKADPVDGTGKARAVPTLPVIAVANAVYLSIDAYLCTVERHAILWGRDAPRIAGKRLEVKGVLLSAINRPERPSPPLLLDQA